MSDAPWFAKALVLGATGPTGFHLVSILKSTIPALAVASRSARNLERLFPGHGLERIVADATRESDVESVLEGRDIVFDCIGLPGDQMHLHPVVANNIALALRKTGARCVQISSFWSFLPIVKLPLTEEHPRHGGPAWACYRREAEDILREAGAAVLHLPDFYGPRVHTGTLQNALRNAARGRPVNWIGGADVEREYVYVPDAMKIAVTLAQRHQAYGESWILPGSGPLTGRKLAELTGARLRPAAPAVLGLVSLFNKELRSFMPMVPHYVKPIAYDARKLYGLIGPQNMTPYADGIRETLDSCRT